MSMRQYRVALLRKEFPFLDQLDNIRPEEVDDIKIKRGDRALLMKKGSEDSYSWSWGGHWDYTHYAAVWSDENGQQRIEWLEGAGHSSSASGENNDWDADSIGEQLFTKGICPDYIIECVQNDTDDNGNGCLTHFWTIFKMKRFDLAVYHQERIDEAATVLKTEIAAVCA